MPGDISQFDAGNLRLEPSQTGEESVVRSAYRIGSFGRQQAQAYDQAGRAIGTGVAAAGEAALQYEDHRELSKGAADGAQMLFNAEQQWNNIAKTADPNDPSVAAKFRDGTLEPALEDFQNQFHTERSQAWAQEYVDRTRQHMFEKTSADQSTLAGIAAHDNLLKTANTLAAAVSNDPSSLGMAFDTLDHSAAGMVDSSPTISATDAAMVKETYGTDAKKQLVQAAVHGAIANGGDWRGIAEDPKYAPYINAPEIQQFDRVEKFYRKLGDSEADAASKQQLKQQRGDLNQKIAAVNQSMMGDSGWQVPDGTFAAIRSMMSSPAIVNGDAESMKAVAGLYNHADAVKEKLNKPEPRAEVSQQTAMRLLAKIRSGDIADINDKQITAALPNLSTEGYNFIQGQLEDNNTPVGKDRAAFFKRYSLVIDPDQDKQDQVYRAEVDAKQQEDALRTKGQNPADVYNPSSPFFFGRPANLQKYKQPLQQQMSAPASELGTSAPAAPDRPKNFPGDAQWNGALRYWFVTRDGKKFRVTPTGQ